MKFKPVRIHFTDAEKVEDLRKIGQMLYDHLFPCGVYISAEGPHPFDTDCVRVETGVRDSENWPVVETVTTREHAQRLINARFSTEG